MADVGENQRENVTDEVDEAVLSEGKRAYPDAPVPTTTSDSEPSEGVEHDLEEAHLPYATDPTPGAVTAMTPKTTKAMAAKESNEPIVVGAWAFLADTDHVEEIGGTPGTLVYVTESEKVLCTDPDCDISPREHYHQHPKIPLTVRTRDDKGQYFKVWPDDLSNVTAAGRSSALPIG